MPITVISGASHMYYFESIKAQPWVKDLWGNTLRFCLFLPHTLAAVTLRTPSHSGFSISIHLKLLIFCLPGQQSSCTLRGLQPSCESEIILRHSSKVFMVLTSWFLFSQRLLSCTSAVHSLIAITYIFQLVVYGRRPGSWWC